MLETAVDDSSEELGLQKEISETGGVNSDVRPFLVGSLLSRAGSARIGLLDSFAIGGGNRSLLGLYLLIVGVINEILFAGHVDDS